MARSGSLGLRRDRESPGDGKSRIVPRDGDVLARVVGRVDAVGDVGRIGQGLESVGAFRRDVDGNCDSPVRSNEAHCRYVGDRRRRSSTTSKIASAEQRTNSASP